MKTKTKMLFTIITTAILIVFWIDIINAKEYSPIIRWTFIENNDKDENWNYKYWAQLKLNWYYFNKHDYKDYIWKNVEVEVKWNENKTFELLNINIIEEKKRELTEYQKHKLYFFKNNIQDLTYEQKIMILDFIEKENISVIIN